jgi:hypothetical protein
VPDDGLRKGRKFRIHVRNKLDLNKPVLCSTDQVQFISYASGSKCHNANSKAVRELTPEIIYFTYPKLLLKTPCNW